MSQQILPALLWDILSILNSTSQSLITTSDDAYDPVARYTKGWRQFTGIEHTKPTAGTCSDIKQPPSPLHPRLYSLYQRLYLMDSLTHSLSHQQIFFVDVLKQF